MSKIKTSISICADLGYQIAARGRLRSPTDEPNLSGGISHLLERYFGILRRNLPPLTEPEAALLVDCCTHIGAWDRMKVERLRGAVLTPVIASKADGSAETLGVDAGALKARVQAWTPLELLAVMDAVERFTVESSATEEPDVGEVFGI